MYVYVLLVDCMYVCRSKLDSRGPSSSVRLSTLDSGGRASPLIGSLSAKCTYIRTYVHAYVVYQTIRSLRQTAQQCHFLHFACGTSAPSPSPPNNMCTQVPHTLAVVHTSVPTVHPYNRATHVRTYTVDFTLCA